MTASKRYAGLARNDMSLIDSTYDGLHLSYVSWMDEKTGQPINGYTVGMPGPYACIAYYTGVKTSLVGGGYSATVTYSGSVSKQTVEDCTVKATYIGQPAADTQDQPGTATDSGANSTINGIAGTLVPIVIAFGVLGVLYLIYYLIKKRKKK